MIVTKTDQCRQNPGIEVVDVVHLHSMYMVYICICTLYVTMTLPICSRKEREKAKIGLNWKFARRNQEVHIALAEETLDGLYKERYYIIKNDVIKIKAYS